MASTVIHMAVAHEINKELKRNEKLLLLGAIAPDISKEINQDRRISHFSMDTPYPNLMMFKRKYQNHFDDDFVFGYYIHLYTDYVWEKTFIPNFNKHIILDDIGNKMRLNENVLGRYLYNDYTNMNTLLLDEYTMDLSLFYEELPKVNNIITEIPMDKLYIIVNKADYIIQNSKEKKLYLMQLDNVKEFVSFCVETFLSEVKNGK